MVSFAGYPLVVDDRLVGVMAMFARRPLSDAVLQALGAVSREVGLGVVRKRAEAERNRLQQEVIEAQQSLLAEPSTPLIPPGEGVVVMPPGRASSSSASRSLKQKGPRPSAGSRTSDAA